MEQYIIKQIEEFLAEHPEARPFVMSAWALGFNAGCHYSIEIKGKKEPEPKNPFKEEVPA